LQGLAKSLGVKVRHVKTHGSLGNMAAEDSELAMAVARAILAVDPELIFVVMPGLETERAGERLGLPLAREIYADRAYAGRIQRSRCAPYSARHQNLRLASAHIGLSWFESET
jgi:lactam utilization protein B